MLVGDAGNEGQMLFNGIVDLQRRLQEVNSSPRKDKSPITITLTSVSLQVLDHLFLSLNQNRPRTRRNFSKVLSVWHKIEEDATQLMIAIRAPMQHIRVRSLQKSV